MRYELYMEKGMGGMILVELWWMKRLLIRKKSQRIQLKKRVEIYEEGVFKKDREKVKKRKKER